MNVIRIKDLIYGHITVNSCVKVYGWVKTRRDSKIGLSFIALYDGSCFNTVQVVADLNLKNYHKEVRRLTTGCSIIVTGIVKKSLNKKQIFELQAIEIQVVGWIDDPDTYPLSAKRHSLEYLREIAHLRPRTNLIGAIVRVRHTLSQALQGFLNDQGFFWVNTPLITTLDTEGAGELFRVSTLDFQKLPYTKQGYIDFNQDFFGKEAFLTVSGQLNLETYACALSKVYTFGPAFRAENSNTSRHLAEFWMLEVEVAFATLDDIIALIEKMLKYVFNIVLKECLEEMNFFVEYIDQQVILRLKKFLNNNLMHIEYSDAIKILEEKNHNFKSPIYWGMNLSSEHERYLSDIFFNAPIAVKNYPKNIKAFYMRLNDDGKTVAAMDILAVGIGEIIGGSQREERLEVLDLRMQEMGLKKEEYWWYRDLRRYGTIPHSGFGLGFERLLSYVTGIKNIKDVIPFARTPRNANF